MKEGNFWEKPILNNKKEKEIPGVIGQALRDFENDKELVVGLLKKEILKKNGAITPREALREVFLSYIEEKYPDEDISKAIEIFDNDRKAIADLFCQEYLKASSLIQEETKNKKSIFKGRPISSIGSDNKKSLDYGLKVPKTESRLGGQDHASGNYK